MGLLKEKAIEQDIGALNREGRHGFTHLAKLIIKFLNIRQDMDYARFIDEIHEVIKILNIRQNF